MSQLWSLYNREEKLRIDDLSREQVKIIMLAISARRMPEWYVNRNGEVDWRPLTEVAEFIAQATQIRPLKRAAGGDSSATSATLVVDFSAASERRSARRYARRLRFKCEVAGHMFACETVDVSMKGLSLSAPLPAWVPKYFQAVLSLNHQSAKIECQKVSGKKLKLTGCENWDLMRQWIVNF